MFTAYVVATVLVAAANAWAASNDFVRPAWIDANMVRLGVPDSWLSPLGALKLAGAAGLLVGIAVPPVGVAAAVGLILFFVGAIVTVVRARFYAHYYPVVFLVLAVAALVMRLAVD